MNKKIISISALVVLLAFGFLYTTYLSATGKDCSQCMFTSDNSTKTAIAAKSDNLNSTVKNNSTDCKGNCTGKCPENKDGKSSGNSSQELKQPSKICPNGCPNCKNKNGKNI